MSTTHVCSLGQLVMSCTSPMPQRGWANQPWILRFLSVFNQPMSAMRDRRCPKMSERHVRSWPVFKWIEDRVAIFRAKAETRGILITSLSSAPACKFSMPGDTQVLSAVQHEALLNKKLGQWKCLSKVLINAADAVRQLNLRPGRIQFRGEISGWKRLCFDFLPLRSA